MAHRDDTIRTDAIANVRAALQNAASDAGKPRPEATEIARRIAPNGAKPGYTAR